MLQALVALALLVACPFAAASPAPHPILVASEPDTGRVIFRRPLAADGFTLAFDHSMYGGEVRERFVPAGGPGRGSLRRVETTTANAAAAEYYAYDAPVVRQGERFRVDVPPLELPDLVVRVDWVGKPRLLIGGERLDLVPVVGDGRPVRLALGPTDTLHSPARGVC